jgi:hypothetical protein
VYSVTAIMLICSVLTNFLGWRITIIKLARRWVQAQIRTELI